MSSIHPERTGALLAFEMPHAVSMLLLPTRPPHRARHTPRKVRGSSRDLRFLLHYGFIR